MPRHVRQRAFLCVRTCRTSSGGLIGLSVFPAQIPEKGLPHNYSQCRPAPSSSLNPALPTWLYYDCSHRTTFPALTAPFECAKSPLLCLPLSRIGQAQCTAKGGLFLSEQKFEAANPEFWTWPGTCCRYPWAAAVSLKLPASADAANFSNDLPPTSGTIDCESSHSFAE